MNGNTSPVLTITDILRETQGILVRGDEGRSVQGVATDSRTLLPGNLFIALRGEKFDGHRYLDQALAKGAGALLVHQDDGDERRGIPVILVPDTLTALGDLAHAWRKRFSMPVLAITGSSGKTTTKEMTAAILSQRKNILKTEGNYNNLIGLPFTLFRLQKDHEAAIVELGTNRPGEIARLTQITAPDMAAVTNIGPAHLEGFGSLEGVAKEKGDIFRYMPAGGTMIMNGDDTYSRDFPVHTAKRCLTFGLAAHADVSASDLDHLGADGIRFTLNIMGASRDVRLAVTGQHNVKNALAAAALAWAAGSTMDEIVEGLAAFKPISGRMEIIPLGNGAFLVNDTYNANPASVREALSALRDLRGRGQGVAVLGDMLELGHEAENRHREIGGLLADTGVSRAYLRGRFSQATAAGALNRGMAEDRITIFDKPAEILTELLAQVDAGDWILVKGSRGSKMEDIANGIVAAIGRIPAEAGHGQGGRS